MGIILEPSSEHDEAVWYAPDFDDNRDLPEADRAAVLIKPISGTRYRKIEESCAGSHKKKMGNALVAIERRQWAVRKSVLKEGVVQLRNFMRPNKEGGHTPIASIDELMEIVEAGPASQLELLYDIADAIIEASTLDKGRLAE